MHARIYDIATDDYWHLIMTNTPDGKAFRAACHEAPLREHGNSMALAKQCALMAVAAQIRISDYKLEELTAPQLPRSVGQKSSYEVIRL